MKGTQQMNLFWATIYAFK